jgi:hypothetical protein
MGAAIRRVVKRREENAPAVNAAAARRSASIRQYAIIYQKQPGRSDCFIVSVRRRGRTYTRRFALSKHGGSAAALMAAIAWRNKLVGEEPVFTLREFHDLVRSNNTSGIPGVTFIRPSKQQDGVWQAKLSRADGHRLCRMYSVRKFGFEEAFALAAAARLEFIASLPEQSYLVHPIAKRLSPKPGRHVAANAADGQDQLYSEGFSSSAHVTPPHEACSPYGTSTVPSPS